ncbi:MAG: type II toxin-antitoxin system Phd/YefM family antitoxin [Clostridiales bacterium]|jgi:prevent-host-death family protein|nr:type II toxin-antitoxin system Phd/YefM family antitoxin [Clostridiales bacterium]
MFSTHVKAVRDLRNNYPELAKIVKNRDHVIITNNGKSEAVLIPYEEMERYQEFLHICYVKEKLAEVEVREDDPNSWTPIEDFLKEWDNWDGVGQ